MVPEVLPICASSAVVVAGSVESLSVFLIREGKMENLKPLLLFQRLQFNE